MIRHDKKKVLENSFLYIFSALLVNAVGFLLLPIYTRFLEPADYGITNLINGFTQTLTFVVAFSLYSAVIRFYADYKDDHEKLKDLYSSVVNFLILSGLVFFLIGMVFKNVITGALFENIPFYPYVFIAFLSVIFVSLHTMHQSILQGMQKGRKLVALNLIVFFTLVVFKLLFLWAFHLGALGFLIAQLIVDILYFFYMIYDLKKSDYYHLKIDFSILFQMLIYSVPLMPHNLSTRIANFISRVFINNSATLASVGLYSIAMQFSGLIDTVQTAVNKAFQPWFFEMMKKKDPQSRMEIVRLSELLLVFYSLIYMIIGMFSQEMVILLTEARYLKSWTVIPILVVGFSIKSMYYFYVNIVMFYKEAARKLFIAAITGSLIDVVLAFYLVKVLGMYGAAISFLIAKAVIVLIVITISKQHDDVGYRVMDMLKIIVTSLLFMGAGLYFSYTYYQDAFNLMNLLYKFGVLSVYLLLIGFKYKKVIQNLIQSKQ